MRTDINFPLGIAGFKTHAFFPHNDKFRCIFHPFLHSSTGSERTTGYFVHNSNAT